MADMVMVYFHDSQAVISVGAEDFPGELLARLLASGKELLILDDLCRLASCRDESLAELVSRKTLCVLTLYASRAVRWLFAAGGAPLPEDATLVNLSDPDEVADMLSRLGEADTRSQQAVNTQLAELESQPHSWRPWFPVIDYDRCVKCRQCAGFCLFGVYEVADDNTVTVAQPDHCKNDCPACARVCPAGAILFPKFPTPPINGGDGGDIHTVQLDVKKLVDGDVMAALRKRSAESEGAPTILRSLNVLNPNPTTLPGKPSCDCSCSDGDAE